LRSASVGGVWKLRSTMMTGMGHSLRLKLALLMVVLRLNERWKTEARRHARVLFAIALWRSASGDLQAKQENRCPATAHFHHFHLEGAAQGLRLRLLIP